MPLPGANVEGRSGVRASLSDEAISPHRPLDATDAFQLLVEGATEYAVFALSPDGVVSTWNKGAERMKGYQADEIIGKHFSVFYPTEERQAAVPDRELADAMADGLVSVQGWRVRQDGSRFWANVTITPLWDGAGHLRGFAKLTRDETDRHSTEQLRDQLTRRRRAGAYRLDARRHHGPAALRHGTSPRQCPEDGHRPSPGSENRSSHLGS